MTDQGDPMDATRSLYADARKRAWALVERLANEPHELSTPVLPNNLARELLQTKADLVASYEAKVQDFAAETRRASFLQAQLDREHEALTELWQRYEELRCEFQKAFR